jgi:hypothetical protein
MKIQVDLAPSSSPHFDAKLEWEASCLVDDGFHGSYVPMARKDVLDFQAAGVDFWVMMSGYFVMDDDDDDERGEGKLFGEECAVLVENDKEHEEEEEEE